jgi:DNA polymerase sigma
MQIDERLPALVRLVKAWAGARGLNDASNGTFNSYALTLLVRTIQSAPSYSSPCHHCHRVGCLPVVLTSRALPFVFPHGLLQHIVRSQ